MLDILRCFARCARTYSLFGKTLVNFERLGSGVARNIAVSTLQSNSSRPAVDFCPNGTVREFQKRLFQAVSITDVGVQEEAFPGPFLSPKKPHETGPAERASTVASRYLRSSNLQGRAATCWLHCSAMNTHSRSPGLSKDAMLAVRPKCPATLTNS